MIDRRRSRDHSQLIDCPKGGLRLAKGDVKETCSLLLHEEDHHAVEDRRGSVRRTWPFPPLCYRPKAARRGVPFASTAADRKSNKFRVFHGDAELEPRNTPEEA